MQFEFKNITIYFLSAFLLLILCLITYGNVLNHPFMMDDIGYLEPSRISSFYPHLKDFFTTSSDHHYAPLNYLLNVTLFSRIHNAFFMHLINLFLFYINCFLLFVFVFFISRNLFIAISTSFLFCIHPMTAEVLQHITFNIIYLQTIFMELGLLFLYLFSKNEKDVYLYFLSIFMLILALLCQETALLFSLFAAILLFFISKFNLRKIIYIISPYLVLSVVFIFLWMSLANQNIHIYDQFNKFELTFSGWCANFSYLVFWYVSNLLVPRDIILMYSMSPLKDYIWFWDLFFCFFWIGGGVLIFFYFKKSIESFALSLFLMGFIYALPASIARPYMGFVIEPYWFYFSSIGFYLFVVLMLFKLRNKVGKGVYIFTLIVLSLSLFFCSQGVNHTASNKVSYYANWLKKSPGNLIPMRVLSIFYIYDEQWPITEAFTSDMLSAVDFYIANNYQDYAKRLIRKVSLSNLSLSQQKQLTFQVAAYHCKYGLKDQCRDVLRRILDSSKEPVIYMQLSHLFYKVGDNEMSIDLLRKCINLYPKYKEAYFVAGFMLSHQGRYQESIDLWQQGRDIDPSDLRFVSNINKTRKMIKK